MPAPASDLVSRTLDVLDRLQPPGAGRASSEAAALRKLVEKACQEQGWSPDPAALEQALRDHWQACPPMPACPDAVSTAKPASFAFGWRRPTSVNALDRRRRWAWVTRLRLAAHRRLQAARLRGCQPLAWDVAIMVCLTTAASVAAFMLGGPPAAASMGTMAFFLSIVMLMTVTPRVDRWWWSLWARPTDPWASVYPSESRVKRWTSVPTSRAYLAACLTGSLPMLLERDADLLDWLSRHASEIAAWSTHQSQIRQIMNASRNSPEGGRTTAGNGLPPCAG